MCCDRVEILPAFGGYAGRGDVGKKIYIKHDRRNLMVQAYEFQTALNDGIILVPAEYQNKLTGKRLIIC